ncbi:MAG: enoyl-CoA hydratase-related protein [Candidatus Thalassarchaeaceae archaeon]|uniref:Enoyl-CoA hydratase/isomerase (LiuC) n=1 Tax=uncultured Poseidoniia archaeon TaxID=1697135 RepID=A0A1B1TFH0_9ARCH|nr:enoyl-CoA hydratase/isomerase (liuC) [uncultured Candidatus Thalassoarchaea sp.]MDC0155927.1 enoyl-CoA hydratase-related protein [Euryarchaeota archaeon]
MKMSDIPPKNKLCQLVIDGNIARINLNRSDVFNALNTELISELISVIKWTSDRSVSRNSSLEDSEGEKFLRVIIFTGEGKHFCAGADINMMRDAGARSVEENRVDSERLDSLFHGLWAHPCFTIGCIQGVALGGGAGLVSCFDYAIAEPRTRIALSEAKLGILPAVIGPYVYRKIGSSNFRRLSMMASKIGSVEAMRIGLIDFVVESSSDFDDRSNIISQEVLTTGPMAVTEAKNLTLVFDRWDGSDEELRNWTLDKTSQMRGSEEGQEGLSSFLERRKPNWSSE